MPNAIFDSQTIDIPCPKCGKRHAKAVRWLKTNNHFTCTCGVRIDLDASEFRAKIANAEKQIRDLTKGFR